MAIAADVGYVLFFARRYDEAIEEGRKAVEMDAAFAYAHFVLAYSYEKKGLFDRSIAELKSAMDLPHDTPATLATLARSYMLAGMKDEASQTLDQLRALVARGDAQPSALALAYAADNGHEALSWLVKGCDGRRSRLVAFGNDPRFDTMRSDPAFHEWFPTNH